MLPFRMAFRVGSCSIEARPTLQRPETMDKVSSENCFDALRGAVRRSRQGSKTFLLRLGGGSGFSGTAAEAF